MRSLIENLAKESEKVITRKARLLGNLIETERVVITVVDKLTRPTETLQSFEVRKVFGFGVELSNDHGYQSFYQAIRFVKVKSLP